MTETQNSIHTPEESQRNAERDLELPAHDPLPEKAGAIPTDAESESKHNPKEEAEKFIDLISQTYAAEKSELTYRLAAEINTVGKVGIDGELYYVNPLTGKLESGTTAWGEEQKQEYESQKQELFQKGYSTLRFENLSTGTFQYFVQELVGQEIRSHLIEQLPAAPKTQDGEYSKTKIETAEDTEEETGFVAHVTFDEQADDVELNSPEQPSVAAAKNSGENFAGPAFINTFEAPLYRLPERDENEAGPGQAQEINYPAKPKHTSAPLSLDKLPTARHDARLLVPQNEMEKLVRKLYSSPQEQRTEIVLLADKAGEDQVSEIEFVSEYAKHEDVTEELFPIPLFLEGDLPHTAPQGIPEKIPAAVPALSPDAGKDAAETPDGRHAIAAAPGSRLDATQKPEVRIADHQYIRPIAPARQFIARKTANPDSVLAAPEELPNILPHAEQKNIVPEKNTWPLPPGAVPHFALSAPEGPGQAEKSGSLERIEKIVSVVQPRFAEYSSTSAPFIIRRQSGSGPVRRTAVRVEYQAIASLLLPKEQAPKTRQQQVRSGGNTRKAASISRVTPSIIREAGAQNLTSDAHSQKYSPEIARGVPAAQETAVAKILSVWQPEPVKKPAAHPARAIPVFSTGRAAEQKPGERDPRAVTAILNKLTAHNPSPRRPSSIPMPKAYSGQIIFPETRTLKRTGESVTPKILQEVIKRDNVPSAAPRRNNNEPLRPQAGITPAQAASALPAAVPATATSRRITQ